MMDFTKDMDSNEDLMIGELVNWLIFNFDYYS